MRKTLASLVLYGMSLFNPLNAITEEIKPELELIVNYETETSQSPIDYSTSINAYFPTWNLEGTPTGGSLWSNSSLTNDEEIQIETLMSDIQNNNITSYQEFLEASQNLSENQQLVLASAIGNLLNRFNYDINLIFNEVKSQEDFFSQLQDSLINDEDNSIGTCGHFATHLERFLNDVGVRAAAVTGISDNGVGHAYDIAKIENGTAIVDSYNILTTDTKNIEKTLQAYQKYTGVATLQHLFFEDAEFEYRLITQEGKHLLDFVEYDESSVPLKNSLINSPESQCKVTVTLNLEDSLTSFEQNLIGFFVKVGEIRGDNSSPLEKINLSQIGFKRNFSILDLMNINTDLSLISGGFIQDAEIANNTLFGAKGNLIINTNNEEGLNFTSRIAGNYIQNKYPLFHDFILGAGTSYTTSIDNLSIKPYLVSQFSFFPNNLGNYQFRPRLTELTSGISLNSNSNDANFSIAPYYLWRIWEQGFGGQINLGTEGVGVNAGGQITFSTYDFCPDKYNLRVGAHLNLGNLEVRANLQTEATNYDGEKETQESFNIQGSIKY